MNGRLLSCSRRYRDGSFTSEMRNDASFPLATAQHGENPAATGNVKHTSKVRNQWCERMNVCGFHLLARRQENGISSEVLTGVIHELKGELEQFNYRFLVTMDVEREVTIDGKGWGIVLPRLWVPFRLAHVTWVSGAASISAAHCGCVIARLIQKQQLTHHASEGAASRKQGVCACLRRATNGSVETSGSNHVIFKHLSAHIMLLQLSFRIL